METKSNKPCVLAIDDYAANLVALEVVLSSEYEMIEAHSGPEALSILEKRKDIDVILLDIQMPQMDGYETARRIKLLKGYEDIPIIFITAIYKEEPFIKRGYEVGGVDYFSKPFDPEILKMKVGVYAAFRHKHEMLRARELHIRETEELLRTGRKLSSVLESLPVGVLIADVEGRICQVNDQVSLICQTTASRSDNFYGEALGWWDSDGKILKDEKGPLYQAIHRGQTIHNQSIQINCMNQTKRILASASPLRGLDGHVVGAVVVIQDFTESKKITEDLENHITQLVSAGFGIEESLNS